MVGFVVLEDSPSTGKRVVANICRLPSPNSSVHLQVSSLVGGMLKVCIYVK